MADILLVSAKHNWTRAERLKEAFESTDHPITISEPFSPNRFTGQSSTLPELLLIDISIIRENAPYLKELYESFAWRLPIILLVDPDDRSHAICFMQIEARDFVYWDEPDLLMVTVERELQVKGFRRLVSEIQQERDLLLQKHRTLIETVPIGVVELNRKGMITFASSGFHRMFGFNDGELTRKSLARLVPGLDARTRWERLLRHLIMEYTEPATIHGAFMRKDGRVRDVAVDWNYRYDEKGNISGILATCVDLTGKKEVERIAQQHTEVIQALHIGIVVCCTRGVDNSFFVRSVNREACKKTGKDRKILIDQPFQEAFPAFVDAGLLDLLRTTLETGLPQSKKSITYSDEYVQDRVFAIDVFPVFPDCIGIAFDDVTEQVHASQALRDSETRYRSLIEQSTSGIYLMRDGQIELVNRRFTEMLGIAPEEAYDPAFNLNMFVADDSKELMEKRARMLLLGEELPERFEFTLSTRSGQTIPVEAVVSQISIQGKPAVQGILRDITGRQRTGKEPARKLEKTQQALLAYSIEHEAEYLSEFIALISQDFASDPGAARDFAILQDSYGRITQYASQLLHDFKDEKDEIESLDINKVIQTVADHLGLKTKQGERLQLHLVEEQLIVRIKRWDILSILFDSITLLRLGGNEQESELRVATARKLITDESIGIPSPLEAGEYVCLTIRETHASTNDTPFEYGSQYSRMARERLQAGITGLLAEYGGAARFYIDENREEVITLYLACHSRKQATIASLATVAGDSHAGKLMIVDDDPIVLNTITKLLRTMGYDVIEADSTEQALEVYDTLEDGISLLVTDVMLPGENGIVLADKLCEVQPDLKILFISGYHNTSLFEKAVLEQRAPYLQKPFTPGVLLHKIREVLET